ncbi:putative glucan 1,3-beta-glucosidase A [Senna tora]|uniref:Putative glucan 1,3-beta-glucosidase A n=1 Tax=Senna tora TaxID=362788 RepID=A0A834X2E4_9FABA|nr:putative glucan 1,3-beta-glucosidase A [Senna tora]
MIMASFRVKGVNLGGWLVTEGWIKPSLFDAIPNNHFLDGTSLQFKSVTTQKYLCAEFGGGTIIAADCAIASTWGQFRAKNEKEVTADVSDVYNWFDDNDPTVFSITINSKLDGEFQVTNGYGLDQASKEHWNSFIVEDDFKFIAKSGLNAVRIPVGWWTARDPYPPAPYVAGSLQVLDNAFLWAQKYGLKIILDLHATPGCQNSGAHSSARDGTIEWGKTNETIQQTLDVIDFLTARESLYGIELLNEPLVPGVDIETLVKYYKAGYEVVRKHCSRVYVILCSRLSFDVHDTHWAMELLSLANSLRRSVIDVHFYSYYYCVFRDMDTVQQNIDYIKTNRASQLDHIISNGPLAYVGEWSAKWFLKNSTKEEYQQFTKALLEVYEKATFGWTFWTYKIEEKYLEESEDLKPWCFKWMIQNGYINL